MPEYEGELEKKIKRAYSEQSAVTRKKRRKSDGLSVAGTQSALCAVVFTALLALRLIFPATFSSLRSTYDALWLDPEVFSLEAASSAVRSAAEDFFAHLNDG